MSTQSSTTNHESTTEAITRLPHRRHGGKARILLSFILLLLVGVYYYYYLDRPIDNANDNKKGAALIRTTTKTIKTTSIPPPKQQKQKKLELRFDWTNLEMLSPLAKLMQQHQSNCSLPIGNYYWRDGGVGLGSELHVWGAALCNAIEVQRRIRTLDMYPNPWVWIDRQKCDNHTVERSSLACYFPRAEMTCPQDVNEPPPPLDKNQTETRFTVPDPLSISCNRNQTIPSELYNKTNWRAAGVEYLFTRVSPLLFQEAERQLKLVFSTPLDENGQNQTNNNKTQDDDESSKLQTVVVVPKDLIVVHVRWGDKKFESKLEPIANYFAAIERIRIRRGDDMNLPVSILLCTEDPLAVEAFVNEARNQTEREHSRRQYVIYLDQFYREILPYRPDDPDMFNTVPRTSKKLKGKLGLWSLGSLLVSMEANAFVLTLRSNWSLLMNELRKNILNPRCGDCTLMEDVNRGVYVEWRSR